MIVAIAVQAGLTLYQFYIRGTFLCAPIDLEIYLKLPQGYEPPPGKTAKLLCSLYGLKQAPSAFHSLFKSWLPRYGFTAIRGIRVTFLLHSGTSVVLLSIYAGIDDGITATNDEKLYRQFLDDLSKDFELSDQGK
eukprot:913380-Rhodomonas_salina.1